jgi:hypothetical protein
LSLADVAGLIGVALVLAAYTGAALNKFAASGAIPLAANLIGACLILLSLSRSFNLSAAAMEGSWALVSLAGLLRLAFKRRP